MSSEIGPQGGGVLFRALLLYGACSLFHNLAFLFGYYLLSPGAPKRGATRKGRAAAVEILLSHARLTVEGSGIVTAPVRQHAAGPELSIYQWLIAWSRAGT